MLCEIFIPIFYFFKVFQSKSQTLASLSINSHAYENLVKKYNLTIITANKIP